MGICEAPEQPDAILDDTAAIIDAEAVAAAAGHAQTDIVDVNQHVTDATAAGDRTQHTHVEKEQIPFESKTESGQEDGTRTTALRRLDELESELPPTGDVAASEVPEETSMKESDEIKGEEITALTNRPDAHRNDTENSQFEITPLMDWPKLVDPMTLFEDYEKGMPDLEAVQAYIDLVYTSKGDEEKPASDGPSPLKEMGLTSNLQTIELGEGEEFKPSPEAFERWKEQYPIDFAVMAFLGEHITESAEPSLAPVSPVLEADPNADLDLQTELQRYLEWTSEKRPGTAKFIKEALEFMEPPRTNVNELDCIVPVPVVGHQEYGNIFQTLEQYSRGKRPHHTYEIALHLNLPGGDAKHDVELADGLQRTLAELHLFQQTYPTINVRFFVNTYRGTPPPIGHIRADLWDTVALDMLQRGRKKDILMVSGDADGSANDEYLDGMVEEFKESGADVVTANFAWQLIPDLPYNSAANRILRYHTFLYNAYDNSSVFNLTSDASTGVSLAAYLASGGFNRHVRLAEMNSLVDSIRYYRQGVADRERPGYQPVRLVETKAQRARLRSNSRRVVQAMAMGYSPEHTWDTRLISFGMDDELRTEQMQVEAAERNAQKKWRSWLREMTPGYVDNLPEEKRQRVLRAARHILGFSDFRKHA